jgi:hypothetical protein
MNEATPACLRAESSTIDCYYESDLAYRRPQSLSPIAPTYPARFTGGPLNCEKAELGTDLQLFRVVLLLFSYSNPVRVGSFLPKERKPDTHRNRSRDA